MAHIEEPHAEMVPTLTPMPADNLQPQIDVAVNMAIDRLVTAIVAQISTQLSTLLSGVQPPPEPANSARLWLPDAVH